VMLNKISVKKKSHILTLPHFMHLTMQDITVDLEGKIFIKEKEGHIRHVKISYYHKYR